MRTEDLLKEGYELDEIMKQGDSLLFVFRPTHCKDKSIIDDVYIRFKEVVEE